MVNTRQPYGMLVLLFAIEKIYNKLSKNIPGWDKCSHGKQPLKGYNSKKILCCIAIFFIEKCMLPMLNTLLLDFFLKIQKLVVVFFILNIFNLHNLQLKKNKRKRSSYSCNYNDSAYRTRILT